MLLDGTKIQSLNRYMLGLGVPDERDYQGYNRPDWTRMETIGRYRGDFDDRMCAFVLGTLSNYVNTQLTASKDDILESLAAYKERIKGKDTDFGDNFLYDKGKDMFIADGITYEGTSYVNRSGGMNIPFVRVSCPIGKSAAWNVALGMKKRYSVILTSAEPNVKRVVLDIRPDVFEEALEKIDRESKFGCRPGKSLHDFMTDGGLESVKKEYDDLFKPKVKEAKKVDVVSVNDKEVLIHYDGYVQAVNDLKSTYAIKSIYDRDTCKWNTLVPANALTAVSDALKGNGFDLDAAEVGRMIAEEVRKLNERIENKSGNTLIDVNKLKLPFKPYDFQIEDAKEIVSHRRYLVGHDMGLGKSFMLSLVGASIDGPKLCIVPESLRLNWKREIMNVEPNADISVGKPGQPLRLAKDWTVIGYKEAVKYKKELIENKFRCLIVDEAHKCKSVNNKGEATAARGEAVIEISDSVDFCYPMTGTPIPAYNKDVYNIFRMLQAPEVIKGNKYDFIDFAQEYCAAVKRRFGWECEGSSNQEGLNALLDKYMVRRLKKDVLPNLTKQRVFIPVELRGRKYKTFEHRLVHPKKGDSMMQLAVEARNAMSVEKIKEGMDIADAMLEAGKSVVLVSGFNDALDAVVENYKDDCCCIRGGMTDEQKLKAIDDFQSGKVHVCALNTVAGGVGVTLTKASNMIICDYDWTPANMSQVEDRICRSGQTDNCMIHYVYAENSVIDKIFMEIITERSANIDMIVDREENTMDFWSERAGGLNAASFMDMLRARLEEEREKEGENVGDTAADTLIAGDDIEI